MKASTLKAILEEQLAGIYKFRISDLLNSTIFAEIVKRGRKDMTIEIKDNVFEIWKNGDEYNALELKKVSDIITVLKINN